MMDPPDVTVHNHNHCATFLSRVVNFYQSGNLSDVSISCDDDSFACHKLVLCATSVLFRRILQSRDNQTWPAVVHLVGVEGKALEPVLRYMYTGEVQVDGRRLEKVFKVANELCIEGFERENIHIEKSDDGNVPAAGGLNSVMDFSCDMFQTTTFSTNDNDGIEAKNESFRHVDNKDKVEDDVLKHIQCPIENKTKYSTIRKPAHEKQIVHHTPSITPAYRKVLMNRRRENLREELEITKKINFEGSEDDFIDIPPTPQKKQVRKLRSKLSKPIK